MALETLMQKEIKKQNFLQEKFELDEEQRKILDDEYNQNLADREIKTQEYEELISRYRTQHNLSRNDAVVRISRDRLEY